MLEPKVDVRRLENYIAEFESKPVVKNKILFYGDSSFTRWKPEKWGNPDLEKEILMRDGSQAVVNHGFGSSTAEELLYYYPRAVRPWEPRALVLQTYGNDRGFNYSPMEILFLLTRVMDYARADFPGIRLFLGNVRPVLKFQDEKSRWQRTSPNAIAEFNQLVELYCASHPDVTLVDHRTCEALFLPGKTGDFDALCPEFFVEDRVHYNAAGYAAYKEFFLRYLRDLL